MARYLLLAIVAITLGAYPTGRARAVEFPYTAYVNSNDVYVRSGPGRNYYPTDKLQKGMKVEIYRHDPGGWYAIRPPRNSYSWVSARHLDVIDERTAVVNGDRAVARVGSAFSNARDVIQVRLEKGEKVELVAPAAEDSPWRKVAPPAGEFRWVFAKFVEREDGAGPDADYGEPEDEQPLAESQRRARDVRLASAANQSPAQKANLATESGRAAELAKIDLELSAMVVEETSAWSFAELTQRAEAVLSHAQSAAERGQARIMIDKLARFEDIKQRHDASRAPQDGALASTPVRAIDPRYDGVGRIAPVVSQRPGAPQYALVDGSNTVVSFLTPAPGVNLRPYVDRQVGVNGQRGFMTDLRREHISVQRVTLMDSVRR